MPDIRPQAFSSKPTKVIRACAPGEAVSLLNTVLKTSDLAAIKMGRVLKIVSASQVKTLNVPVRIGNDPTKIDETDEVITQIIPIRYVDASQLQNDLSALISSSASFSIVVCRTKVSNTSDRSAIGGMDTASAREVWE